MERNMINFYQGRHDDRAEEDREDVQGEGQGEIDATTRTTVTENDPVNHISKLPSNILARIVQSTTNRQQQILTYRLVCHQWNCSISSSPTFDFHFHLVLSDSQTHDYLTVFQPTLPKLKVSSIETHDLTQLSVENLLSILHLVCFQSVKQCEFGEGTTDVIMQILLRNIPNIQILNLKEIWCPVFDFETRNKAEINYPHSTLSLSQLAFNNLREFSFTQPLISPIHSESISTNPENANGNSNGNGVTSTIGSGYIAGQAEELQNFFKIAFFPQLQKLELTIVILHDDLETYLTVHYFIGKHYKTLKELSICFYTAQETKLKTASWVEIDNEINETDGSIFKADAQALKSNIKVALENDGNYSEFCSNAAQMKLTNLTLFFMKQEGLQNSPWNQSIKFLTNKNNILYEIEINCGSEFDSQKELLSAIQSNAKTLKVLCIRNVPVFDCHTLDECKNLEAFSFGRLFAPITQSSTESLENLTGFPDSERLRQLRWVLIGVPLTKEKLFILAEKCQQVKILWVRGNGRDTYTVDDLDALIKRMLNLSELEMRIQMEQVEKEKMAEYFIASSEWGIRYLINEFENTSEVEFNAFKTSSKD